MRGFIFLISIFGFAFVLLDSSVVQGADNPNVVLIYVDDMGWADLGANGVATDVSTPNLDALAASGVRFTDGYVTAPQCAPSRAGLMTGKYQQKFGYEWNVHGPLPLTETTIAERIQSQGYTTGLVGKWHLLPESAHKEWIDDNLGGNWSSITEADRAPYRSYNRGFDDAFEGQDVSVRTTFDLAGNTLSQPTQINYGDVNRINLKTQAGLTFLDRHAGSADPFFLYLSYYAPHEPLFAIPEYLALFPGEMPERRRYALAMNAAVDDSVGQIMNKLQEHNLSQDTLVMFVSDNGAPLDFDMPDAPIDQLGWNGSLNTPFVGEKAMLTEGGIRVPFIASWPGTLPAGTVYNEPVLQIDAAATAVAVAGGDISSLDGKNLVPHLTGQDTSSPHDMLYWRFGSQEAVREGNWKLLRQTNNRFWLFDLSVAEPERVNLAGQHPDVVQRLTQALDNWVSVLPRDQFGSSYAGEIWAFNHHLGRPHTEVDPQIVVDFGYDQGTSTIEMELDPGPVQGVGFSGIRLGSGVTADLRLGASITNATTGGGALSFNGWDIPTGGGGLLQRSINSDHYIEFDLTLDGSEVFAVNGIQIAGIAAGFSNNLFSILASNDAFATGASRNDHFMGQDNFKFAFGDWNDPDNPVKNYLYADYVFDTPLLIDEQGTTWTFRLYINEDAGSDLLALAIDSIAFDIETYFPADFDRDGHVDGTDLAAWMGAYGDSAAGDANGDGLTNGADFFAWQRQFSGILTNSTASVPEPHSVVLSLLGISLASLWLPRRNSR